MRSTDICVRISNRSSPSSYTQLIVSSDRDASAFEQLVHDSVKANPNDPLTITANGYEPFLEDIYASCIDFHQTSPGMVNREVQLAESVQLPTSANRRAAQIPWTFIVDQMNLPEVWHWTFARPMVSEDQASSIQNYRFRIGAWVCDQGAYRLDPRLTVVLLYTRADYISEDIVSHLIFPHMCQATSLYDDRAADDAVCWVFHLLYNLLTDWQNIVSEMGRKLSQAELDSHLRDLPVKVRTRRLHKEVDRTYELHDYIRFHSRSFKKLAKFKRSAATANKHGNSIWEVIDDCLEDLEQYENYLDSMKERFNNLIELDFNIENATQSSDARFVSILGAVFLPISFVAGIFSINNVDWPPVAYLYISLPLFSISVLCCFLFPPLATRREARIHPTHLKRIKLHPSDLTMLGAEAPEGSELSRQPTVSTMSSPRMPPRHARPKHHHHREHLSSPSPNPSIRSLSRPKMPEPRPTFYGLPRSPGVVSSRRKHLHDEDTRREQMHFRDFQRAADRAGSSLRPPVRPYHGFGSELSVSMYNGRQGYSRAYTDGFIATAGEERDERDVGSGSERKYSKSDI